MMINFSLLNISYESFIDVTDFFFLILILSKFEFSINIGREYSVIDIVRIIFLSMINVIFWKMLIRVFGEHHMLLGDTT